MENEDIGNDYQVPYYEYGNDPTTGEPKTYLKTKIVPERMVFEFIETFKQKLIDFTITGQEIDDFINSH